MDKNALINFIESFIGRNGGDNRAWYVGIASDPRERLFTDHSVNESSDKWAYEWADTNAIARAVEDYFHSRGCDGGPGGGDSSTRAVYAYLKNARTRP